MSKNRMKGLRKKSIAGFSCIVLLLAFSGVVSMLELGQLSRDAEEIFGASTRNVELAQDMLDAAQSQHTALMHIAIFGQYEFADSCRHSSERLTATLELAREEIYDASSLDSLSMATARLATTVEDFMAVEPPIERTDSIVRANAMWYTRQYEADYMALHNAVKNYITSMQGTLAPRTELLKKNAYRTVMPVLITQIVTILIVLMLFYFVNCYGVQPITELNKRLDDYLRYKLPFAAKGEFVDELASIKEQIEVLITRNKRRIDE